MSPPAPKFADPQIAGILQAPSPIAAPDVEQMRLAVAERASATPRGPELPEVRDVEVADLPARLYRPGASTGPLVLYLHGGGWTIGGIESYDRLARRFAAASGCDVLLLEYRLAPEHPWPAAVDDTVAALRWMADRPSALPAFTAVAVAGDSAGGTLATLACIRLRAEHPGALPDLQVLVYANTDLTGSQPSMREKATGFGLTADAVRFFNDQWVPDHALRDDPRVSPLHAPDLQGLPPALIVTAEHDPLRDEGEAYARRLQEEGVVVTLRREQGLVHNFMRMDLVSPACAEAADRVARDVRALLGVQAFPR